MTALLYSLILWLWENRSLDTISRSNTAKVEAQRAYLSGNYEQAVTQYRQVLDASLFSEPEARLNLAHSYFMTNRVGLAETYYTRLTKVPDRRMAARALTQLGVIRAMRRDTVQALRHLKEALINDANNQTARYNYELLRRQFSGKLPEEKAAARPRPSQTTQPVPPPPTSQQVQQTEEKRDLLNRLKGLNMSEAQAMQLLEAMKTSELNYLQQRKRTTSDDNSRGTW